jgi:hypothetical protein
MMHEETENNIRHSSDVEMTQSDDKTYTLKIKSTSEHRSAEKMESKNISLVQKDRLKIIETLE